MRCKLPSAFTCALAASAVAFGCGRPAQTLVFLHADPATAPGADVLRVEVYSEGELVYGPGEHAADRTGTQLARVPIVPRDDDVTRTFELHAELLRDGAPVSELRVQSGYVRSSLREIHAWFDPDCEGELDCGAGRTCAGGTCVASCFDALPVVDAAEPSRPRCGECNRCTSNRCEPLGDGTACGCAADACAGGKCRVASPVTDFDGAQGHACAVSNGDLYCWGDGHASRIPVTTDVPLRIADTDGARAIATMDSGATCIALTRSGPVDLRACWGWNPDGGLAVGATEPEVTAPVFAPAGDPPWLDIEAGLNHFCGLSRSKQIYCWGTDGRAVGDPSTGTAWSMPIAMSEETAFSRLDTDWQTTCAVHADGRVVCFGLNDYLQAGHTDPAAVAPGCVEAADGTCARGFTDVSVSVSVACGIRDGQIACWGASSAIRPADVPAAHAALVSDLRGFTRIDVGVDFACAIREPGELYCWGDNGAGQLGQGDLLSRATPTRVVLTLDRRFTLVRATGSTACALDDLGALYCWGLDLAWVPGSDVGVPGLLGLGPLPGPSVARPRRVCIGP